jgi:hypothetical protein
LRCIYAAFAFAFHRGSNEEIFGDLDFRRPQFLADLVALGLCQDVAALHDDHFARANLLFGEKATTVDRAVALFGLRREKGQVGRTRIHAM